MVSLCLHNSWAFLSLWCPGFSDLSESGQMAEIDLTPQVKVKHLLASWNDDEHKAVLKDIVFEVHKVGNVAFSFSAYMHVCNLSLI